MSETTLDLRAWNNGQILSQQGQPEIALLTVRFSPESGGKRSFKVKGVADSINKVRISVHNSGQAKTVIQAPDANTGLFEVVVPDVPVQPTVHETAMVEAFDDGSGTLLDKAIFALDDHPLPNLPSGNTALLHPEQFQFLAGISDRIIPRHLYSAISFSDSIRIFADSFSVTGKKVKGVYTKEKNGGSYHLSLKTLQKELLRLVQQQKKELEKPDNNYQTFSKLRTTIFESAIDTSLQKVGKKVVPNNAVKGKNAGKTNFFLSGSMVLGSDQMAYFDQDHLNLKDALMNHFNQFVRKFDVASKVGVLFYERIRFQPSGLVVGEPIYTMSMIPGEEVQLRQTVETKKKVLFEDIKDREQESTFALSSSWSTDVSQAMGQSGSSQSTVTMNTNMGFTVPETPLGANLGISPSISQAHQSTQEDSFRTNQERSTTATQRMRAQHKIRLEVTSETSTSLSTARTIKNNNTQRVQTCVFSKIYRKERATLERYNARLCVRLFVDDPSADMRNTFLLGLDKIDPNNPELYSVKQPVAEPTYWTHTFDMPSVAYAPGPVALVLPEEKPQTFKKHRINLPSDMKKLNGSTPSAGPLLAQVSKLQLVNFNGSDEGERYAERNFDSTSESLFRSLGGDFQWVTQPKLETSQTIGELDVTLPFIYYAEVKNWEQHDYVFKISSVTLKIQADWTTNQADWDAYHAAITAQRDDLMKALNSDKIYELRNVAERDYQGAVIAKAIQRHLSIPENREVMNLRHIFDFEHAIVENLPYWATAKGRTAHLQLKEKLEKLPLSLSMDEILTPALTSSQAVVYFPVREGYEKEALDLVGVLNWTQKDQLTQNMTSFRDAHFGRVAQTLPTYQEVSGPRPPFGTKAKSANWTTSWEAPQRKYDVLGHWQELIPTDGVHIETVLSDSVVTDEHAVERGLRELQSFDR